MLECPAGRSPLWRYWGPRLSDVFESGPGLLATRPTPTFSLDETPAFPLFPGFGVDWFGQSGLLAHRQGRDFAFDPQQCLVEWIKPGANVRISLVDSVAAIRIEIMIALDADSDVMTLNSRVTNTGIAALKIDWLAAAALPLPDHAEIVRHYGGRHNGEFDLQCDRLSQSLWRRENRRGLTSHDAFPGAIVACEGTTTNSGTAYGAQLAWSGNHTQTIEWLDDGRYQWQLGEWLAPGEISLEPDESLTSPDVLATVSALGWGGVARNFHAAIRALMDWPDGAMAPRPVHINTWEGFYFNHDSARLMALADASASVGIERFVLDDGWFHKRDHDRAGLGDWWTDAEKYPKGLAPLAGHVTGLGMEFGLWVEPEMVNPDSDLFRAHPDWALQIAGRPLLTARNQLVLDLSQPAVSDYLVDHLSRLLAELPISYLKWDHNRDLTGVAGADGRATYHRQIEAAYALFDRIRAVFPKVEIEACAGGGGRIDAGIAKRTHRFWISDNTDAVSRLGIQPGFLQFMPPELMGAHIGSAPSHGTGRSQSLDFRAAVACQGHLGVELNLLTLNEKETARLGEWVSFYQKNRALLNGEIWSGAARDTLSWHAAGRDGSWLLFVYRKGSMQLRHMPPIRLPFVERDRRYRITPTGPNAHGDALELDGSWLIESGMPIPPKRAETAIIYRIESL